MNLLRVEPRAAPTPIFVFDAEPGVKRAVAPLEMADWLLAGVEQLGVVVGQRDVEVRVIAERFKRSQCSKKV